MDRRFFSMTMGEALEELVNMANNGFFSPYATIQDIQDKLYSEFRLNNFPADICLALLNISRDRAGLPLISEEEAGLAKSKCVWSPYIPKTPKTTDIEPDR
jgi:hypothetical protein